MITFEYTQQLDGYTMNDQTGGAPGVTFTSFNTAAYALNASSSAPWSIVSGRGLKMPGETGAYIVITLPTAVNTIGFAARYVTFVPSMAYAAGTMHVTVGGDPTVDASITASKVAWVAIQSTTPFTSITLSASPDGTGAGILDDFTYGSADLGPQNAETPEIATLLMIGTGLLFMRRLGRALGNSINFAA